MWVARSVGSAAVAVLGTLLVMTPRIEAADHGWLTILVTSGTGGRLVTADGRTATEVAATVQALAEQARSAGDQVVVLDAGRTLAPYAESRFDHGRTMLAVLAAAGVELFVPSAMDLATADLEAVGDAGSSAPMLVLSQVAAGEAAPGAVVLERGDGLRVAVAGLIAADELADAALPGEPRPQTVAEAFAGVGDALRVAVVHSGGHGGDITSRQLTWRLVEDPQGIDLVVDPDLGYPVVLRRQLHEHDVALVGRDRDQRDPWDVARVRLELTRNASGWAIADLAVAEVQAARGAIRDDPLEAMIQQHMAAFRAATDRPLPAGAPQDRAQLEQFVLEAMRERAGAEITVLNRGGLRPVDAAVFDQSPLRYEAVMRLLSLDQELVVVALDGAGLRALVEASLARVTVGGDMRRDALRFAGLTWRVDGDGEVDDLEVNGRPLRSADRYRVATTSYLVKGGDEYPPLMAASPAPPAGGGRPLEVRDDVVLPRLARAGEPFSDLRRIPEWRYGISRLGLGLTGIETSRTEAYDDVSDSRVTAPSSASVRLELDAYVVRSLPAWRWENLLRGRYATIETADAPRDELADDVHLDTSVVVTAATLLAGGSPYASAILDTEVRRNPGDDGTLLPRRREESLSAGLTWASERWPRLRVGGVVRRYGNETRADQSGLLAEALYRLEPQVERHRPGLQGRLYVESLWGGGGQVQRFDLDLRLLVPAFGNLMVVPAVDWYHYDDSTRAGSARALSYSLGLSWSFAVRTAPTAGP